MTTHEEDDGCDPAVMLYIMQLYVGLAHHAETHDERLHAVQMKIDEAFAPNGASNYDLLFLMGLLMVMLRAEGMPPDVTLNLLAYQARMHDAADAEAAAAVKT